MCVGDKRGGNHDCDKLTSRAGLSGNVSPAFTIDKMPYVKGLSCLPTAGDHAVCEV